MNLTLLLISLLLTVKPEISHGRKGRGRSKHNASKRTISKASNMNGDDDWIQHQDTIDAVDPKDYKLPNDCEKELETTMRRCLVIWQNYCKCEQCNQNCKEEDWPPVETVSWNSSRTDIGWENLTDAWKWSGKCAYNSTDLWRGLCAEGYRGKNISRSGHGYKYLFLTRLSPNHSIEEIKSLCEEHECAKWASIPTIASETTAASAMMATNSPMTMATKNSPMHQTASASAGTTAHAPPTTYNQDILDALGPKQDVLPKSCSNEELSRLLRRCVSIWQAYCRCADCNQVCDETEWPPPETEQWRTDDDRTIGWEEMEHAWKWAGKCSFNATDVWRSWCGDGTPEKGGTDGKEHEYWFLTALRMDNHPKFIKAMCEQYECWKWKKLDLPTSNNGVTPTRTVPVSTIDRTTAAAWHFSEVVPRWAYALIAALVAIVILLVLTIVSFCCFRKKAMAKARKNERSIGLRGQTTTHGRRETDNSTSWQPQTSFTFFGQRSLPGIDEIYHTIGDAPLPTSPVFAFESFSPTSSKKIRNGTQRESAKSVRNVLYHDTVPGAADDNQHNVTKPTMSDGNDLHEHTYEDTQLPNVLGQDQEIEDLPPPPPITPPYFLPVSSPESNPGNEYGTLQDMALSDLGHDGPGVEIEANDTAENVQNRSGNYDHIKLI